MVVFLSQLCWSQFVNTRLCQAFQVSLCYRKNLWSRELFGKWRHNRLAKGNPHRVNNAFGDKAAWELSRTHATMPLMNCARVWYRTDQESGNLIGREPGLSFVYLQSLLISLINVCANIYVIWNKKLITAQLLTENASYFNLFVYLFFYSLTPRVSTRGIASNNKRWNERLKVIMVLHTESLKNTLTISLFIQASLNAISNAKTFRLYSNENKHV